jgi:diguanylate cyclase (GGDEF)-like protein
MRQLRPANSQVRSHLHSRLWAELSSLSVEVRKLRTENIRLRRMATTDFLTRIANRAAFRAKLYDVIRETQEQHIALSLLIVDVDEFNTVNNRFGHPAGDRVLRRIAEVLRATIRESDFVARYAGDEFVVLLPSTDRGEASSIAERIREAVAGGPWPNAPVTISIGIATLDASSLNARRLIREADRALFRAKDGGRNQVGVAPSMKSSSTIPATGKFRPEVKNSPRPAFLQSTLLSNFESADEPARRIGS